LGLHFLHCSKLYTFLLFALQHRESKAGSFLCTKRLIISRRKMEWWSSKLWNKAKPFAVIIALQFGYAGMSIITKFALNDGLSQHVLVVYRHIVATAVIAPFAFFFDRKDRPKMTPRIFFKIAMLGLLEPAIDQNLYYTGMKLTTATFATSMKNVLPAFTFVMACFFRLEKVKWRKMHSQGKVLGTVVTVAGAMVMTCVKGSNLELPWKLSLVGKANTDLPEDAQDPIKGSLMIAAGCLSWAAFMILQAVVVKEYPAELTLTALICMMGAVEGTVVAVWLERNNPSAWSIAFDTKLLACVYTGVICSGVAYYAQGVVMRSRGPVFVTAFNPLGMVIVTIAGAFFLSEELYLGRVIGAVVIVVGLYLVLWGKMKDVEQQSNNSVNAVADAADPSMEIVTVANGTEVDDDDDAVRVNGADSENCISFQVSTV
ncbi:WAT1-related protein At2g39510, partial [Linum perenne]